MPSINHIHTYIRMNEKKGSFKCAHPLCSHNQIRALVVGKASLCNKCGEVIPKLTSEMLKRSRPCCINCMETKEALEYQRKKKILEELGIQ